MFAPRPLMSPMKIAAVKALAALAREPVPESVLDAYSFGGAAVRPRIYFT